MKGDLAYNKFRLGEDKLSILLYNIHKSINLFSIIYIRVALYYTVELTNKKAIDDKAINHIDYRIKD